MARRRRGRQPRLQRRHGGRARQRRGHHGERGEPLRHDDAVVPGARRQLRPLPRLPRPAELARVLALSHGRAVGSVHDPGHQQELHGPAGDGVPARDVGADGRHRQSQLLHLPRPGAETARRLQPHLALSRAGAARRGRRPRPGVARHHAADRSRRPGLRPGRQGDRRVDPGLAEGAAGRVGGRPGRDRGPGGGHPHGAADQRDPGQGRRPGLDLVRRAGVGAGGSRGRPPTRAGRR